MKTAEFIVLEILKAMQCGRGTQTHRFVSMNAMKRRSKLDPNNDNRNTELNSTFLLITQ